MTNQPPINQAPAWDWWIHTTGATPSYPAGSGLSSATPAQTGTGKGVILHAVVPLTGFAGTPAPVNGAGTSYFAGGTFPVPANPNGSAASLDLFFGDGLGVSGGSNWLISYSVLY